VAASPLWQRLAGVASLTGAAILLASSGGFGTIVGVVLPEIRAYNRVVVFVAFLAFSRRWRTLRLADRQGRRTSAAVARALVAVLIVLVGVFDQTTPAMIPAYGETQSAVGVHRNLR